MRHAGRIAIIYVSLLEKHPSLLREGRDYNRLKLLVGKFRTLDHLGLRIAAGFAGAIRA